MKTLTYEKKVLLILATLYFLLVVSSYGQICTNSKDTVYSLNTTGTLYPINVNNGGVGTPLATPNDGNTPTNSNGLGYSSISGKFYYFARSAAGSAPFQDFVSYDPATNTVASLPLPSSPALPNGNKIRSGTVNNTGSGYYTIDPSATSGNPTLYFFNIVSNAWVTITTSFLSPSSVSLNATFKSLNSGDMAFDGLGNLWMVISSTSNYALYKISAPVPTTAVASVTATQIIASTAVPVSGHSFTGLAFNNQGALYLSTGTGDNKLYVLNTAASSLTLVGTISVDDAGSDLTYCKYPSAVLASVWVDFTASVHNGVQLSWTSIEDNTTAGYDVQYSSDNSSWKSISFVQKKFGTAGVTATYNYTDNNYISGVNNYYRIVQTSISGNKSISVIKTINAKNMRSMVVGPNPAKNVIYFYNRNNASNTLAQVFDKAGRLVLSTMLYQNQQSMDISRIPLGSYLLRLVPSGSNESSETIEFLKM